MKEIDFLCGFSLNGEIPLVVKRGSFPQEFRGRKIAVDSLEVNNDGTLFGVSVGNEYLHFPVSQWKLMLAGTSMNIAVGLKKLGFDVRVSGGVDNDFIGRSILHELNNNNISYFSFPRGTGTPLSLLMMEEESGNEELLSTIFAFKPPYQIVLGRVLMPLKQFFPRCLIMTGVRHSELEVVKRIFRYADARSKKILVPSYEICKDFGTNNSIKDLFSYTDLLQVNEVETEALIGKTLPPEEAVQELITLGPKVVILTLGHRGAVIAAVGSDHPRCQSAFDAKVVDTIGAGDGFLVGYLYADYHGFCTKRALEVGAWVAARNIERVGGHGGMPPIEELQKFLKKGG